jgi:flagellar protein FliO/FliZ
MTGMASPVSPLSVGSLTQLTLSLVAIVALIFAMGWILKRFRLAAPRRSEGLAVLDELKLGPRERIALIRVGESQVLIGIGAGGIVPLAPLTVPITLKVPDPVPAFADRLRDLMKRPGGAPSGAAPPGDSP